MKTAHYSQGYASSRGADNHNWHVGINGAVGGLMQLNVSRTESWDIARPSRIQLTSNPPVATAV